MADAQTPGRPEDVDASLDRLEAALETLAHGLGSKPAQPALPDEVERRLDTVIEHVKTVLGRNTDQ